jgi:hypothetical protein
MPSADLARGDIFSGLQGGYITSSVVTDTFDVGSCVFDLLVDHRTDGAAHGGQCELDFDVSLVGDLDLVDEAEVHDVDAELGVVDRLERLGHLFADVLCGCHAP